MAGCFAVLCLEVFKLLKQKNSAHNCLLTHFDGSWFSFVLRSNDLWCSLGNTATCTTEPVSEDSYLPASSRSLGYHG